MFLGDTWHSILYGCHPKCPSSPWKSAWSDAVQELQLFLPQNLHGSLPAPTNLLRDRQQRVAVAGELCPARAFVGPDSGIRPRVPAPHSAQRGPAPPLARPGPARPPRPALPPGPALLLPSAERTCPGSSRSWICSGPLVGSLSPRTLFTVPCAASCIPFLRCCGLVAAAVAPGSREVRRGSARGGAVRYGACSTASGSTAWHGTVARHSTACYSRAQHGVL